MLINIPHASEIQKTDEHDEELNKHIQKVLKDIERRNAEGLSYAPFAVDYRYEKEVKQLFLAKGYRFEPTGYIGGVWQLTEDIHW